MSKVAVVTGGTSGIGKQTALALKAAGYTVYELSRRAQGVEGLHHLVADITREELVDAAIGEVLRQEGHIDVVVNNAGFGISGAIEFTKTEDAKRLFDADFFGMVNVNRAVIPHMRQAGAGRIVNLSSVAAAAPIPFQAYSSAAKAAVNRYTMARANELRPYGVTVCAVPATALAEEAGLKGLANVILVGKLFAETRFCSEETIRAAVAAVVPARKKDKLAGNLRALELGVQA